MSRDRKHWFSQMYQVKDFNGYLITMYVVNDLTDAELAKALAYWTGREDYDYCAALKAEADLRNIKLTIKQKK